MAVQIFAPVDCWFRLLLTYNTYYTVMLYYIMLFKLLFYTVFLNVVFTIYHKNQELCLSFRLYSIFCHDRQKLAGILSQI